MLKNKKFARYAIAFCILGVVWMFFYSGLQNDQINIIQGFSGWSNAQTLAPMTVGSLVCIVLTMVYGTCFIKFGVRKTLTPCIILSALGCAGIAAANGLACNGGTGNYVLYAISLFIVRCTCMCFQMSGFQLAASWFIRYRGRVLGIITLGSPLFSVIGTSVMTSFISNNLGGDYRPFYYGLCIVLVIIAILGCCLLRDFPDDVGLFPDGADTGSCNVPMLVLWGFGVACMTGGVPTMHPASISFAFGRREYQAANRIIMAIQLIPCAFAAQIMAALINSSNDMSGWIMCLVLIVIGLIFTLPMFKMKDSNAADRG